MSTFTTQTKQKLNWVAPVNNNVPTTSTFTTTPKTALNWTAPAPTATVAEVDFLFSDGSDFLFTDSSDYVFKEGVGRQDTSWTQLTKS